MFSEILSRKVWSEDFHEISIPSELFLIHILSSMGGMIGPPMDREIMQTGTKRYANSHGYAAQIWSES